MGAASRPSRKVCHAHFTNYFGQQEGDATMKRIRLPTLDDGTPLTFARFHAVPKGNPFYFLRASPCRRQ